MGFSVINPFLDGNFPNKNHPFLGLPPMTTRNVPKASPGLALKAGEERNGGEWRSGAIQARAGGGNISAGGRRFWYNVNPGLMDPPPEGQNDLISYFLISPLNKRPLWISFEFH